MGQDIEKFTSFDKGLNYANFVLICVVVLLMIVVVCMIPIHSGKYLTLGDCLDVHTQINQENLTNMHDNWVKVCIDNITVKRYEFVDAYEFKKEELLTECVAGCNIQTCIVYTENEMTTKFRTGMHLGIHNSYIMYNHRMLCYNELSRKQLDCFHDCKYKIYEPHIRYWNETICTKKISVWMNPNV